MRPKLKINFIYKSEHKIFFAEMKKRLSSDFQIKEIEWDENLDLTDHELFNDFCLVSEDIKEQKPASCFGYVKNAQIIINDEGRDYNNLDLYFVVKKFDEIKTLKDDFSALGDQIENEVSRLQTWYRKQVPMREQKNAGIQMYSKHKSGNQSGGDFFDTFDTGASIQLFLTHTNSYLLNAKILEIIMQFKMSDENQLEEIVKEFTHLQTQFEKSNFHLSILEISKRDLSIKGYQFGGNEFFSPSGHVQIMSNTFPVASEFEKQAYFEAKLNKGEGLILSSVGSIHNWQKKMNIKDYYDLLRGASKPKDDMENIVLKLYEQDSLEYDTSIIWLEVDSYGIHEA